jgi:5-methyltetrahydropteroyltriglutamate--homocysteine methyltransferase
MEAQCDVVLPAAPGIYWKTIGKIGQECMVATDIRSLQTIRVDHTGALRAPKRLRDAAEEYQRGALSKTQLDRLRDETIEELIRKQEAVGLPVVTDGELRRKNFQDSFNAAVEGFDVADGDRPSGENIDAKPFTRTKPAGQWRWRMSSRLRFVHNVALDEFNFGNKLARRPVKVTLLSPDRIADRFDYENSRGVYRDVEEFLSDVVRIEREIVKGLVEAGCRYIQIDAPGYTSYVDEVCVAAMRARGEDPDKVIERSIEADNAVIEGFDNVVFGLHICRGGARTIDPATGKIAPQWHREGHYDAIAERLFGGLKHQRLLLEYDSDRAGSFEPLRFIPKGKIAVLGLVTTKSPDVESSDVLKRRIDEAARYVPLDQLALSPQCGFGGMRTAALTEDVQWRKFAVIVETAQAIWG